MLFSLPSLAFLSASADKILATSEIEYTNLSAHSGVLLLHAALVTCPKVPRPKMSTKGRAKEPVHLGVSDWVRENKKYFLPPVCNKMMHNTQLKVNAQSTLIS